MRRGTYLLRGTRGTGVKSRQRYSKGLTLVEALIASVLLTVIVAAVSQAIVAGHMQVYDAVHRGRALELAQTLMDEILRLPYVDPDSNPESGRANFDNLTDFHGFTEAAGSISDAGGTAYAAQYQVFSRSVTATTAAQSVTGFTNPLDGVNITVTVQDNPGTSWTLQQFVPEPPV